MARRSQDPNERDTRRVLEDTRSLLQNLLGNLSDVELAKIKPHMLEGLIRACALIAARGEKRSAGVLSGVLINPKPIAVTAPPKVFLRESKLARRGKPVDHEVDFLDGEGPIVLRMPLLGAQRLGSTPPAATRPRSGRPRHEFTEKIIAHIRQHKALSPGLRAKKLKELGVKVSRSTVRKLERELETAKKTRRQKG